MNGKSSLLSTMARLFAAQAGMYCVPAVIAGIVGVSLYTAVAFSIGPALQPPGDPMATWQSLTVGGKLTAVFGLMFAMWLPVFLGARGVCRIATEQISGRTLSLTHLLADVLRFVPAALIYSLVVGLPASMGLSMCFIPFLLIAALFALVVPAGVNEPGGIFTTLKRGMSLGLNVYGKLFLMILVCTVLMAIVVGLRIVGLDRFLTGSPAITLAMRFAVMYIPGLLLLVLANICFTLVYMQARGSEARAAVATAPQTAQPPPPPDLRG